ncbi:MAG: Crp/Fnr family transcriptional regulator [Saprospiraceae bacterium]|nr:Crp/Fnr family transcriptional regulator [Saprospiraceae bacterium]
MKKEKELNQSDIKSIVSTCFDESKIKDIISICDNRTNTFIRKNENLYLENSKPEAVYYLREGKVKIFKKGINGKNQIVRFVSSGDLFGLRSIITGKNHSSSVVAIEDSNVCEIPIPSFLEMLKNNPDLSYCIIDCLNKQLIEAEQRNLSIIHKTEKERLAETLILVYNKFGSETINLLKKNLIDYTNIDRNKITKYLHDFSENQLIAFNSQRIKLKDIKGLKDLAKISA